MSNYLVEYRVSWGWSTFEYQQGKLLSTVDHIYAGVTAALHVVRSKLLKLVES